MANPEHLAILKQGVEAWNAWRLMAEAGRPVLAESDLSRLDLRLYNLAHANLFRADLGGAQLGDANLSMANLGWTSLIGADLSEANLTGAFLTGARVNSATFGKTIIAGVDLSAVRGLPAAQHTGRSRVAVDTLELTATGLSERPARGHPAAGQPRLRPRPGIGRTPHPGAARADEVKAFLRGAGLPERVVETFSLWVQDPADFSSCFISYSHSDKSFARRLHDSLQARGIRCWLDEKDLKPGERILDTVGEAIRLHDRLLICCSEASLAGSWWVKDEIRKAQDRERKESRLIIIPLMLDRYLLDGWQDGLASDLTSRLAADFTGWEQDNAKFEAEFERVVGALRA
jgi:uncharacterized protein YjbI with pentapeptide repeats